MVGPSQGAGEFLHLPSLSAAAMLEELRWLYKMVNIGRPSRLSPLRASPPPALRSSKRCRSSIHSPPPPPTLPYGPVPPSARISESLVCRGVKSFPNGSTPGPSGLRPSHLREAVDCPSSDQANKVLIALTGFVNLLAAGHVPSSVLPYLCGATLLACRKKNGGLRPIAVGEVLRRLTSKSLSTVARQTVINSLYPLQLGVCVRGGCEAIIHSASQLMSSTPPDQRWFLLLDFHNAFNSINRESMFEETLPVRMDGGLLLLPTSPPSGFRHHPQLLWNATGDPLGPLGFALTLHPVAECIKAEVPGLALNAWFLDDGTLAGPSGDLAAALHIIERDGPSVGLYLNRAKSLLFIPEEADASLSSLPPNIPITRGGAWCPTGTPSST